MHGLPHLLTNRDHCSPEPMNARVIPANCSQVRYLSLVPAQSSAEHIPATLYNMCPPDLSALLDTTHPSQSSHPSTEARKTPPRATRKRRAGTGLMALTPREMYTNLSLFPASGTIVSFPTTRYCNSTSCFSARSWMEPAAQYHVLELFSGLNAEYYDNPFEDCKTTILLCNPFSARYNEV